MSKSVAHLSWLSGRGAAEEMKIAEAWTRFSALLPPISTWESHLGTLKKSSSSDFDIWKWLLMNCKFLKLLFQPVLQKLLNPAIPDRRTLSKFGEHG